MTDVIQATDSFITVRFTTESTGKAPSTLLRAESLNSGIAGRPVTGESR